MERKASVHDMATLRANAVLGANDGIITTFAIIAGATGASLSSSVVVVLGLAKVFADALSMASGVFLGLKSEIEYQKAKNGYEGHNHSLAKHASITFFAFVVAGILPLFPYILQMDNSFYISAIVVFVELFVVGSLKTLRTKRRWIVGGIEMLVVGGSAAFVAYLVGYLLDSYVI